MSVEPGSSERNKFILLLLSKNTEEIAVSTEHSVLLETVMTPKCLMCVFPPEMIRLKLGISFLIEYSPYLVVLLFSPSDVKSVYVFPSIRDGAPSSVISDFCVTVIGGVFAKIHLTQIHYL